MIQSILSNPSPVAAVAIPLSHNTIIHIDKKIATLNDLTFYVEQAQNSIAKSQEIITSLGSLLANQNNDNRNNLITELNKFSEHKNTSVSIQSAVRSCQQNLDNKFILYQNFGLLGQLLTRNNFTKDEIDALERAFINYLK